VEFGIAGVIDRESLRVVFGHEDADLIEELEDGSLLVSEGSTVTVLRASVGGISANQALDSDSEEHTEWLLAAAG